MSDENRTADGPELNAQLRRLEPPAVFDERALRERIRASAAALDGHAPPGESSFANHAPPRDATGGRGSQGLRWLQRAAAAAGFFALGLVLGRATDAGPTLDAPRLQPRVGATAPHSSATPAPIAADRLAVSIQASGTHYVSSLALLSEMRSQLSAEERQQAKEVALAVLNGAMAELLAEGDAAERDELFEAIEGIQLDTVGGTREEL